MQCNSCWALLFMCWQWTACSCYCSGWGQLPSWSSLYFAVPCFVAKTPVIPSVCFVYCWTALAQCQGFLSHPLPKTVRLNGRGSLSLCTSLIVCLWISGEGSEQRAEWLFGFWPGAAPDSCLCLILLVSELELRIKLEFCQQHPALTSCVFQILPFPSCSVLGYVWETVWGKPGESGSLQVQFWQYLYLRFTNVRIFAYRKNWMML